MTVLPLYRAAREAPPTLRAAGTQWAWHPGLWFEKFFDRWESEKFDKIAERGKQEWIATVVGANQRAGEPALMVEHHRRRAALIAALGGSRGGAAHPAEPVRDRARSYEHPIENGFQWHPLLGIAVFARLRASRGCCFAWAKDWNLQEEPTSTDCAGKRAQRRRLDGVSDALIEAGAARLRGHDRTRRGLADLAKAPDATPSDWVVSLNPNSLGFSWFVPARGFLSHLPPGAAARRAPGMPSASQAGSLWRRSDWIGAGGKTRRRLLDGLPGKRSGANLPSLLQFHRESSIPLCRP